MFKKTAVILALVLVLNINIFASAHVPPLSTYTVISEEELNESEYTVLEQGEDWILIEIDGKTYIYWF